MPVRFLHHQPIFQVTYNWDAKRWQVNSSATLSTASQISREIIFGLSAYPDARSSTVRKVQGPKVGWGKAPIRGNKPTRPIYITTAQIATKFFLNLCCHIAYERKHKKKQDFKIVSTKCDLVDL